MKNPPRKLLKECDRLARMQGSSAESGVIRSYLDAAWPCLAHRHQDHLDQAYARKVLDREHYGLQKVKERILELLAVRKLNQDVKGQIICLVGPPGVGKTSIAHSIAECMDRKFARMSLGGVHDEAADPRPPPHLHRRDAGPHHQRHHDGQVHEPCHPARRDRQAGGRLQGRPVQRTARGLAPSRTAPLRITTSIFRLI